MLELYITTLSDFKRGRLISFHEIIEEIKLLGKMQDEIKDDVLQDQLNEMYGSEDRSNPG